jgi:chlorite dismutase
MSAAAATPRLFSFIAGEAGPWRVEQIRAVAGETVAAAAAVSVVAGAVQSAAATWTLRGITSNERYVERGEKEALVARQEGLGRPAATRAALIPLRKNAAWWALTQDERRAVFEAQSQHIAIGLKYLPAVARRLHHCRDLGTPEPFDFITWFEYAPADQAAFDDLLEALRASPEWQYVDREVDIRLIREKE